MSRETLVIGDVHGHLDRLDALLRQENLVDRCYACQATELRCDKCWGGGWSRTDRDVEVVLLGDVGHFGEGGSPTGDLLSWEYALLWADVILWGNHDRACVDRSMVHSGYIRPSQDVFNYMAQAREAGKLKLAYEAHGFLITHAGLALQFRDQKVDQDILNDPAAFCDWINEIEEPNAEGTLDQLAVRDAIGRKRGGRSPVGGILWRDIEDKLYTVFPQVFGHSADSREHAVRYVGPSFHTRKRKDYDIWSLAKGWSGPPSYCIDVGGKGDRPGDECLAGIYLPSERIVRVDL
jgi:hypothetical protein